MFYVYALKSLKNGDLYIGFCEDLTVRFRQPNSGKVLSTKAYKPWALIYYEAYLDKRDATIREKQLKMHAVKQELRSRINNSLGQ